MILKKFFKTNFKFKNFFEILASLLFVIIKTPKRYSYCDRSCSFLWVTGGHS